MLKAKASICSEQLMRTVHRRFSWLELKPRHLYEDPQLAAPCDLLAYNLDNRNLRGRCNKVTLAATATSIAASAAHSRPAGRHRMCRGHPASATVISDHQPTQQRGEHHNEKGGRITPPNRVRLRGLPAHPNLEGETIQDSENQRTHLNTVKMANPIQKAFVRVSTIVVRSCPARSRTRERTSGRLWARPAACRR